MSRVPGGLIGEALARYDELKAVLLEAEEEYDQAVDRVDEPDATPEDFDALENFRDAVDEATRDCYLAADTVIALARQVGIFKEES